MGIFCETGRDAASAKCKAGCGAVVSWDCRHFCLLCSLRVPLTPASPAPTPSPSPSRSRSRHRSRCPSPSSRRQDLQILVDLRRDLQIIADSQNSPRQRSRSPSPSSRRQDLQILVDLRQLSPRSITNTPRLRGPRSSRDLIRPGDGDGGRNKVCADWFDRDIMREARQRQSRLADAKDGGDGIRAAR